MRLLLPFAVVTVLALAGCAGGPAGQDDDRIRVVTSTDVWGDVVAQVGGTAVDVTSLVDDPGRDPHEYQADVRDQLAVSRAQLVVVNGGGYDDFLGQLLANAPDATEVVDAADASGLDQEPAEGEFNEHLWYDLGAVGTIAEAIAEELSDIDPGHERVFASGLERFRAGLQELEDEEESIRAIAAGEGVAITEPVPLYMTEAVGLENRTPEAFSEAIEEGDDVAPAVLQEQLRLLTGRRVVLLAHNEQTTGATTEQVLDAAEQAGVPVVGVRETLPDGQDYLTWMRNDLAAIRAALTT